MSGLLIFQLVCSVVSIVAFFHVIVWSKCTTWHLDSIPLIYSNRSAYLRRKASPPWFIRYARWFDRVVLRKQVADD